MSGAANESAISESIGVILMVALTVVMAAIIASFAFGLMNGVPHAYLIAVTAVQTPSSVIEVSYRGGLDYQYLQGLTIVWPNDPEQTVVPKMGDIWRGKATPGKDHVIVIGHFPFDKDQVVLDTWV